MIKNILFHFPLLWAACLYAQNPGDNVFNTPRIFDVRFSFDQHNYLDSLNASQETKEYILGNVKIDGESFDSVGVRFKGFSSFWGYPGNKKAFRIKFDKFREQRFDGLNRINLNNGWSDPTMLREKLYLDFLNAHDIIAPRANFARVYIDTVYWGLYTLGEHVDKTFLQNRFGKNDGNLFKAERLATLEWQGTAQEDYYENYTLQTNEKENDWSDLLRLINVINNTSPFVFQQALEQVLNTDSFIHCWAANNLFINLDSYLGSANNFYMYNDESDNRFQWIIWDVNLAFGARTGRDSLDVLWYPAKRPLIEQMMKHTEYRDLYKRTLQELSTDFNEEYFYPRIDSLFNLIKADYFADTLKMYTNEQIVANIDNDLDNIPGLKSFINNRKRDIEAQLNPSTNLEKLKAVKSFKLLENYPNPFNPLTTIKYSIDEPGMVSLKVFDLKGRQVADLINAFQQRGVYKISFDASGLSSGIYFIKLITGKDTLTKRMLFLK